MSGVPSTIDALMRGGDPLAATRAAGRLLAPRARRDLPVLAAAALAHAALCLGWTAALQRLPPGPGRAAGYGLAIATVDLGLAHLVRGPRFGPIAGLPVLPQVGDHVVFALAVDAVTRRERLRGTRRERLRGTRRERLRGTRRERLRGTGRGRSSAPRGAR